MLQTTVASRLSEPLPEIELKTSDIGRDEIAQLIKGEEIKAALQVLITPLLNPLVEALINPLADAFADRILARLGNPVVATPTVASTPTVQTTVAPTVEVATEVTTAAPASTPRTTRKKRTLTPEAKARISASQKKRWENRDRHLTEEAKRKISDSQRKRWAVKNGTPLATPCEADTSTEADCQPQHNNLADVENATVAVAPAEAVLAVREGYKGDTFYIASDGHFIGEDGFVVPKDFDEFLNRYPKYIEGWVRRRLHGQGVEEDIEDWVQDLIIHMKYLPPKSKHRTLGKSDVIETFDPFAQYGASERRWRNYVNYCLANKYNTIHGKKAKNPVCRAGNMSLVAETNPEMHGEVTDEYIYSNSTYLADATDREEKKQKNKLLAHRFIEYVQTNEPDLFPVLEAVYVTGSSTDTIKEYCQTCKRVATTKEVELGEHKDHEVGMSPKDFNRARNRLKQLAASFVKQRGRKRSVKSS